MLLHIESHDSTLHYNTCHVTLPPSAATRPRALSRKMEPLGLHVPRTTKQAQPPRFSGVQTIHVYIYIYMYIYRERERNR